MTGFEQDVARALMERVRRSHLAAVPDCGAAQDGDWSCIEAAALELGPCVAAACDEASRNTLSVETARAAALAALRGAATPTEPPE